uniref:Tripartite motif-containing protein 16-like n=1 Tax=Gouania willdenowi TaxID=441366 RepID=A0A8C5E4R2_GOUWI
MEQQEAELQTESFSCSICLDLLKEPVTTSCGHSYCWKCISKHWDAEEEKHSYSCPQCRETFIRRPDLKKNIMLAELVEELKKNRRQDDPVDERFAAAEDVACDVCTERKLKASKSCLNCVASYCEKHLQPHHESAALKRHKLVDPSKKIQETICSHHDEVMKMFCRTDQQCICIICSIEEHKDHDMVSASRRRPSNSLLIRQWSTVSRCSLTVSELREHLHKVLMEDWNKVCQTVERVDDLPSELRTRAGFLKYSQEITLDPNTVYRKLRLSEGNRKVSLMREYQLHPDHPDRFTGWYQVLSGESLTGRCYWEVEWRGRGVEIVVTHKSISRAGRGRECGFGLNDKSWMLECSPNSYTFYHNNIYTLVSGPQSSRIGVYVDHTAGILSFYSVSETMTLLHRVITTFTEPLYAGVCIYYYGDSVEFCKLINC